MDYQTFTPTGFTILVLICYLIYKKIGEKTKVTILFGDEDKEIAYQIRTVLSSKYKVEMEFIHLGDHVMFILKKEVKRASNVVFLINHQTNWHEINKKLAAIVPKKGQYIYPVFIKENVGDEMGHFKELKTAKFSEEKIELSAITQDLERALERNNPKWPNEKPQVYPENFFVDDKDGEQNKKWNAMF